MLRLLLAASIVNIDRSRRLTGDFLLTWFLHPGTAIYLGYTNTHENLALVPGFPECFVARTDSLSTTTGRQVFVKVSYLIQR